MILGSHSATLAHRFCAVTAQRQERDVIARLAAGACPSRKLDLLKQLHECHTRRVGAQLIESLLAERTTWGARLGHAIG